MSVMFRIAREERRAMLRDRVAVLGLALLVLLTLVASFTAYDYQRAAGAERSRYQSQVNEEQVNQPDRHPHRMVHYGHFVFRPLNPLAAFDPGIDAYTGNTLFLEGHRQNSANFGDVRQSSLLLRFGQLTPAFVLQVLAPLLLVFVGHGVIARESESGTLKVLLAQGVRPGQIVAGKWLATTGIAAAILLPLAAALLWAVVGQGAEPVAALVLLSAYADWLLAWAVAVTLLSCLLAKRRDALLGLLAVWAVTVILLPRLVPEVVAAVVPLPTRIETDIAIASDLRAMGDSHNPDDPYFASFRQKVLAEYGVSRVEDLPVNYKGVLGLEGERMTSELFEQYADRSFAVQKKQSQLMDWAGVLSPVVALRRLSTTVSGTDLDNYRRFLAQGEDHRYAMVQMLNEMQAEELSYADERNRAKQNRLSRAHWHELPQFEFEREALHNTLVRALPSGAVILAWLAALGVMLWLAGRRLGKVMR